MENDTRKHENGKIRQKAHSDVNCVNYLLPRLTSPDKVAAAMKISWLIVAAVGTVRCGNVANAPDALACGAPGQFGGCLAHGQFDSTINQDVARLDGRFHRENTEPRWKRSLVQPTKKDGRCSTPISCRRAKSESVSDRMYCCASDCSENAPQPIQPRTVGDP